MEEVITATATVTASSTATNQAFSLAFDSNWALVILTFILAVATIAYALEALRSRRAMEAQLKEIQAQRLSQYDTYVIANQWPDPHKLSLTNLGPGPATRIQVLAIWKIDGSVSNLESKLAGLPVGATADVLLKQLVPDADMQSLQAPSNNNALVVRIAAQTVLGKSTEPIQITLPRDF